MDSNSSLKEFKTFLSLFPEVEMPVTLSSDYFEVFSKNNKPIPEIDIWMFIMNNNAKIANNDVPDDLYEDEFIACLKIPETVKFHAIVYLKIGILKYEYFLHTFDANGKFISKQLIASMTSDGELIKENVAFIDEDLIVLNMEGDSKINENYNPEESNAKSYEINEKGEILYYKL
jgi:hypothetical protein